MVKALLDEGERVLTWGKEVGQEQFSAIIGNILADFDVSQEPKGLHAQIMYQ
jgi:hypothetical protein